MADTTNASNKKISAESFLGEDKVEKYRQELVAEGKIPGTKLNATAEEIKQGFTLYRKNKIEFKNFVEKVLQKKTSVAYSGISKNGNDIKKLNGAGAIVKFSPGKLSIFEKKPEQVKVDKSPKSYFDEIIKLLNSILSTLQNQFKFDKKKSDVDKKDEEREKRSKRESALETVKKISSKVIDKVVAPFKNILERIWNFIFFTLLGRAFTKLMDWLGDPKNAQKVAVLGRFLKDWWPALLGLYFMPFKGFMLKTLGRIAWFAARFALFNPVGLTITGATAAGVAGGYLEKRLREVDEKNLQRKIKESKEKGKPLTKKEIEEIKIKDLQKRIDQISGRSSGNPGMSGGGLIKSNTGMKISGAGPDTQLTALQPGEIVMNRPTVKAIGADVLLSLNEKYGGSNANKPKFTNNIQFSAGGGVVGQKVKYMGTPTYGELPLIKAANSAGIKGLELAAFLTQTAHETGGFQFNNEIGGGSDDYSGGKKFKGRGYIQLTHDYNYKKYGERLGIDLIKNPDLAASGEVAAKIAVMYWKDNVRPLVKNKWDDVFLHSKAVNYPSATDPSQLNGWEDRVSRFEQYKKRLKSGEFNLKKPKPQSKPKPKSEPKNWLDNLNPMNWFKNKGKQGGGLVKENTGMNILGGTADRQLTSLQPGEYVLPVDTVTRLGQPLIDKLVAMTDSNSSAAKIGMGRKNRYVPTPLQRSGRGGMMTLPPITQSSGGGMGVPASGTSVPSFSAVASHGATDRSINASIYGIVG